MMQNRQRFSDKKNSDRGQETDDMQSVIVDLARVTRVQRGGKRLRFRACVGVGNKKGQVGIGMAKGNDVASAVEKATRHAKKKAIEIKLTADGSIPYAIVIKYKSSKILFKPAPPGTGLKAGGVIRTMCDLAGVENISAKILGNNNKLTNAQAFIEAFSKF